jgi:hypothetical protein
MNIRSISIYLNIKNIIVVNHIALQDMNELIACPKSDAV